MLSLHGFFYVALESQEMLSSIHVPGPGGASAQQYCLSVQPGIDYQRVEYITVLCIKNDGELTILW